MTYVTKADGGPQTGPRLWIGPIGTFQNGSNVFEGLQKWKNGQIWNFIKMVEYVIIFCIWELGLQNVFYINAKWMIFEPVKSRLYILSNAPLESTKWSPRPSQMETDIFKHFW